MTENIANNAPLVAIPKEPILMWRDEEIIKKFQVFTTEAALAMTKALEEYRKLDLGELTMEELKTLYSGNDTVDNFIRTKIAGNEPQKVGRMVFSVESIKSSIEVPDFSEFEQSVEALKEVNRKFAQPYHGQHRINFDQFEEINGLATVKDVVMEAYIRTNSHYAETDADKEIYLVLSEIAGKQKALAEKHGFTVSTGQQSNDALIYQRSGYGIEGIITTFDTSRIKRRLDSHFGRTRY